MRTWHPIPRPLAATILAAGQGKRLGGIPKSALRIGHTTILERIVGALRAAGIKPVSVVIGPYRDQLCPLAARCGATVLAHHLAHPSLLDSQRLALRAHATNFSGHDLLLVLADLPLLNEADIRHVLGHWRHRTPGIQALMPVVDGTRGHPLLLSREAVLSADAAPPHHSVRDWLNAHAGATCQLPCTQPGYVTDVDTEADLLRVRALLDLAAMPKG
jgi:molybdenum cofactor cytidylyltransferase